MKEKGQDKRELPKWYDPKFLTPLHVDGLATWDESHRKVQPGSVSKKNQAITNRKTHVAFPRNENGKLDLKTGTYSQEAPSVMKYWSCSCNSNLSRWETNEKRREAN